jgi:hypothetical protein
MSQMSKNSFKYQEREKILSEPLINGFLHLSCTTDSISGAQRVERNEGKWAKLGLKPIYVTSKVESKFEDRFQFNSKLLNAQYGCHKTHQKAWNDFLKTDSLIALITEDDAFPINCDEIIREIEIFSRDSSDPSIPKFLQLGHVIFPKLNFKKCVVATMKYIGSKRRTKTRYTRKLSYGTHCYLVNRRMAEFLVSFDPYGILGLDVILMNLADSEFGNNFEFRRLIFPVSLQERIDSSIPTNQEYKGRDFNELTVRERIACIAER